MRKTLLFLLIVVTIFIHLHSISAVGQAQYTNSEQSASEKELIHALFQDRIEIWNRLYEDHENVDRFKRDIQAFVTEPLLSVDIQTFEEAVEFPQDLDKVLDIQIINIKNVEYSRTEMSAQVGILWSMQGLNTQYEEQINYTVILKKEDERWKLSDYSIYQ